MRLKTRLWILAVALLLLAISFKFYHCSSQYCTPAQVESTTSPVATGTVAARSAVVASQTMTIGSTTIAALIADTPALREQGLSGRDGLPDNAGMLFVFPEAGDYSFWMKGMNFDLDMIWIGSDNRVVGVSKNVPASSYPKVFFPPSAVEYVIEVPAGFSDTHDIRTGQYFSYKTANGQ